MLSEEKDLPVVAKVTPENIEDMNVAVHFSTQDEDIRSLRKLLLYGLKGLAAYSHHAICVGV